MNRMHSLAFRLAGAFFAVTAVSFQCSLRFGRPAGRLPRSSRSCCRRRRIATRSLCASTGSAAAAGMTGSTTNDPRVGLKPGLYDAGEAAMGMEHVATSSRSRTAFQSSILRCRRSSRAEDVGQLGVGDPSKMPKPLQLVIAQLAFANSDFAFQGNAPLPGQLLRRKYL
jgi:hypothetical protein